MFFCGLLENDSHLFFNCNFSRAVWFFARPSLRSSQLPNEQDGVQASLESLITPRTDDDNMLKIITTLWFIWKARNELRFRQTKWSVLQVHYAVRAYLHAFTSTLHKEELHQQQTQKSKRQMIFAGHQVEENNERHVSRGATPLPNENNLNGLQISFLSQEPKCFTDAAIAPDSHLEEPRKASLGIFIFDPGKHLKIHIKAQAKGCSSVLMAEAASLSLASRISARLGIRHVNFYMDSMILATFLNGTNFDQPPDWRIKPYTQRFINDAKEISARVHKISRRLNSKAHTLAAMAFRETIFPPGTISIVCENPNHLAPCHLYGVLHDVPLDHCTFIAVICC